MDLLYTTGKQYYTIHNIRDPYQIYKDSVLYYVIHTIIPHTKPTQVQECIMQFISSAVYYAIQKIIPQPKPIPLLYNVIQKIISQYQAYRSVSLNHEIKI